MDPPAHDSLLDLLMQIYEYGFQVGADRARGTIALQLAGDPTIDLDKLGLDFGGRLAEIAERAKKVREALGYESPIEDIE